MKKSSEQSRDQRQQSSDDALWYQDQGEAWLVVVGKKTAVFLFKLTSELCTDQRYVFYSGTDKCLFSVFFCGAINSMGASYPLGHTNLLFFVVFFSALFMALFFVGGAFKAFGVVYVQLLDTYKAGELLTSSVSTVNLVMGFLFGRSPDRFSSLPTPQTVRSLLLSILDVNPVFEAVLQISSSG